MSSFSNGSFSGNTLAMLIGFKSTAYFDIPPPDTIVCFSFPVLNVIPLVLIIPVQKICNKKCLQLIRRNLRGKKHDSIFLSYQYKLRLICDFQTNEIYLRSIYVHTLRRNKLVDEWNHLYLFHSRLVHRNTPSY